MILTTHLLTGAILGAKVPNPILGLSFAFLSHYFLDFLFHRDYLIQYIRKGRWQKSFSDFLKVGFDISFGILLIFLLSKNLFMALAGGFFAILPDGFTFLFLIFPENKLLEKHYNFHRKKIHFFEKKEVSLFWETFSQILIIFITIFFLR